MLFTGNNILKLQRGNEFFFSFNNIRVSDWNENRFILSGLTVQTNIFLHSGFILKSDKQTIVSTYNTGEPFFVSGWFINEPTNSTGNLCAIFANEVFYTERNLTRETLDSVGINVTSETLTCDVSIYSHHISSTFDSPANFPINSNITGIYSSSVPVWSYGNSLEFFNSLEQSLTGHPVIGCLNTGREPLVFIDNDSSQTNNDFDWTLRLALNQGENVFTTTSSRTGLFNIDLINLTGFNNNVTLQYPFEGSWSGSNFVFSGDNIGSVSLTYFASQTDGLGNINSSGLRVTGTFESVYPPFVSNYTGAYLTGFVLTCSGEYFSPPQPLFSGYYYVTGIQQALNSLLFSSGCTGRLGVGFSGINGFGNGATGKLLTTQIQFQNVYGIGDKYFYVVNSYSGISGGTGYTENPVAIINTGEWGTNCFDVPLASGYNQAWFSPFNSLGATLTSANYLTGEVLCVTGLISGGLATGYLVTGINITNLGSGYSRLLPPLMKFARNSSEIYTGDCASGTLQIKDTGSSAYVYYSYWKMATGLMGRTLYNYNTVGNPIPFTLNLPPGENYFNISLSVSGIDITEPMIVKINLGLGDTTLSDTISGLRSYSTDPYYLKKKLNNTTGIYLENDELGFLITQSELDTTYSSDAYINNGFSVELGDLDF